MTPIPEIDLANESFFQRVNICADRSTDAAESPFRYVDELRWRQPEKEPSSDRRKRGAGLKSRALRSKALAKKNMVEKVPPAPEEPKVRQESQSDIFQDLEAAEDVDRVHIATALLDQRKSLPLYWERKSSSPPSKVQSDNINRVFDIMPVLSFLKARLTVPKNTADLGSNRKLPRVLFYDKTSTAQPSAVKISNQLLHTKFRRGMPKDMLVSLELCVGFLGQAEEEETSHVPCLVFLLRGDASRLPVYLERAFEAGLLIISSSEEEESMDSLPEFLITNENNYYASLRPVGEESMWEGPDYDADTEELVNICDNCMSEVFHSWAKDTRWMSFNEVFLSLSADQQMGSSYLTDNYDRASLDTARVCQSELFRCASTNPYLDLDVSSNGIRERMELQFLFSEEEELKKNPSKYHEKLHQLRQVRRPQSAVRVRKDPLIAAFVLTLEYSSRSERILHLQRLGDILGNASVSNKQNQSARKRIRELDTEENKPETPESRKKILSKHIKDLENRIYKNSVDLPCLFREMGYLFVALEESDPESVANFPDLATQHLLDGGTIEFMDGDAAKINTPWVNAILKSLNLRMKILTNEEMRLSIRSVFGLQSCGKSTVLNCMFGCRLATSAGMCTRGINMFLVPCKRPGSPFHAVLGLDTEGVSSPEQERTDSAETSLINNRMALFCVLLADAGLCISTTETNDLFRETLSIVMAVFHGSDIGTLRTRLFFLYNRAQNENDVNGEQMKRNQDRVFQRALNEGWKHASNQLGKVDGNQRAPPDFVKLLDRDRDIERVKQLNQASTAPNDVPEPDFGKRLSKFNDHIYRTLVDNRPQNNHGTTIGVFLNRIRDLEEAINIGQNYLLYPDIMRYRQKEREQTTFEMCVQEASKLSYSEFEKLRAEMQEELETRELEDPNDNPKIEAATGPSRPAATDWDLSNWPDRLLDAVNNSFARKKESMVNAMKDVLGSTFERKMPPYEKLWDEKCKIDYEGKKAELKKKFELFCGVTMRVIKVKKGILDRLTDVASSIRKTLPENVDFSKMRDNEDVKKQFDGEFEPEINRALIEDPNILVAEPLFNVVMSLYPKPSFGQTKTEEYYRQFVTSNKAQQSGTVLERRQEMNKFEQAQALFGGLSAETSEDSKERKCQYMLKKVREQATNSPDEFSKHVGRRVLNKVNDDIRHWNQAHLTGGFSDSERTEMLMHAVQSLIQILQPKQDRHHKTNGLAGMLSKERDSMFDYFLLLLNAKLGQGALKEMLTKELNRSIEDSMSDFVSKHVTERLSRKPWMKNTESTLALVDVQLLEMFRDGRRSDAIQSAVSPTYFQDTISREIEKDMDMSQVSRYVVDELKQSLIVCKEKTRELNDFVSGLDVALDELKTQAFQRSLTIDISTSLMLVQSLKKASARLEEPISKVLDDVAKSLTIAPESDLPTMSGREVHERLARERPTEQALQLRCGINCPTCAMPCMKEKNHDKTTSSNKLHDCTHQPQGMTGRHHAKSLVWESCVDSRRLKHKCKGNGVTKPYSKWHKVYPEWEELPTTQKRRPVREFLFTTAKEKSSKCTEV